MENPELYQKFNNFQKREVNLCLREYGSRIRWVGQDRVADLGSGDGGITAGALRSFLPRDFSQLVGCDVSASMVKYALAHYEDERTTFREMDLGAPLPHDMKGSFDHVFSFHAIHWVYNKDMENPELYEKFNNLPKRDFNICLREHGGNIQWQGQDRVADLGCGDGGITAGALRSFLPRDFTQLVGYDVSAGMVKHARAHYEDERTTFREMDLGAPLPHNMKGSFDHAFTFYAIHWVHDQERVFMNIYEMLAPGGDCLLMFMTRQPTVDMFRLVAAQTAWRSRLLMPDLRFFFYHDSQQPEKEVMSYMQNAGFKDIIVERKVMKYTFDSLEKYIGGMLSISPFDIPEELREEYIRAHLQAVRDLRLPTYRLEESAPGRGRLHIEYGVIVASARK